jgi:restriction system protein
MSIHAFIKGWLGEQGTRIAQKLTLDSNIYHVFYDILIEDETRPTQIDHIIVSQYGVFVVETKNYTGWIFGSEHDSQWTQNIYGNKQHFQNPLVQNKLHTKMVADFCSIGSDKIHSVVVFWGDCEFKTEMARNVVKWIEYPGYIKSKTQIILTENEVTRICAKINEVNGHIPILTNLSHVNTIKNQFNESTVCPKCGGKLIERTTSRRGIPGEKFMGCENYPRCHYTRDVK